MFKEKNMKKLSLLILILTASITLSGCTYAHPYDHVYEHRDYSSSSFTIGYRGSRGSVRIHQRIYQRSPYYRSRPQYHHDYYNPPPVSHTSHYCGGRWERVRTSTRHSFIRTCRIFPPYPIKNGHTERWRSGGDCHTVTITKDYSQRYRGGYIVTERKTLHCQW